MIFRVHYMTADAIPHVYMQLFAGKDVGALGLCGNLTMRKDEFEAFRRYTEGGGLEFIEHDFEARLR